ncbi:hypothetical protein G9A89_002843 [Geosiphon pyriformis]|nr:hypothetical protein G9A89_002843 [Geosiphon pyriformis]
MGDIIKIPERIIIGYLTTEIEEQLPNTIPDFSQLCRYVNITSQTIYEQKKMLSASTKTIGTDKLGKSRSITMYATQNNKKNPDQPIRVITEPEKETILFNMHSDPTAEHFHKEATMKKTRKKYYWPSMYLELFNMYKIVMLVKEEIKQNPVNH